MDALQALTRIYINANSEHPITDELKPYPRPATLMGPAAEAPATTIDLAGFFGVVKEKL